MRTVLAIALLGAALLFDSGHAATLTGSVVGISDGDTITVLDATRKQHKVRLAGIDAPEKGQSFGKASKEYLSRLIFNQVVVADCYKHDRYGREICRVYRGGIDIPLEQVRAGYAWHYVAYAKDQTLVERTAYAKAESDAQSVRRNLWKDVNPEAPWEWRAKGRSKKVSQKRSSPSGP